MKRNKKKRHMHAHEESWAVSYADLLMVLMSFFIVFFNLESGKGNGKEESLVEIISTSFTKDTSGGKKNKIGDGPKDNKGKINNLNELKKFLANSDIKVAAIGADGVIIKDKKEEGISSLFDKKKVSKVKKVRGLEIKLPDDIFSLGAYKLNKEIKVTLDQILEGITKYREKITIVVIGHADAVPMKAGKKVIQSNFILSSLRSSKAVEYLIKKGYDRNFVAGQAVSVENRASRSLSLRIFER
ncbi:MAG: OmpA family protein [Bacteriovoracaceae bacterium]|jgi:chemotaxis protein MotB|nr:OmpA family protein [Bacteriovoracaceae bacterium]